MAETASNVAGAFFCRDGKSVFHNTMIGVGICPTTIYCAQAEKLCKKYLFFFKKKFPKLFANIDFCDILKKFFKVFVKLCCRKAD